MEANCFHSSFPVDSQGWQAITLHLEKCIALADTLCLPVTLFTLAESGRVGSQCTDVILCEVSTL